MYHLYECYGGITWSERPPKCTRDDLEKKSGEHAPGPTKLPQLKLASGYATESVDFFDFFKFIFVQLIKSREKTVSSTMVT